MNLQRDTWRLGLLAVLGLASVSQAAFLANGDFETYDSSKSGAQRYTGWTGDTTNGKVADASTPLSGSHSPLLTSGGANGVTQTNADTSLTSYVFQTDFACNDTSGTLSGSTRSFSLNLTAGNTSGQNTGSINLKVFDNGSGKGTLAYYNGSWRSLFADDVLYSTDQNNLVKNTLKVTGDYSTTTPSYAIILTNSLGTFTSSTITTFQSTSGRTTLQDNYLKTVSFGNSGLDPNAWFEVDNASVGTVPEPASMSLLGLCGLALVARRRQRASATAG